MKKPFTILGAIVAILSLVPIPYMGWWWTVNCPDAPGISGSINGWGRFTFIFGSQRNLGPIFAIASFILIFGIFLVLVGGLKNNRKIAILGLVMFFASPGFFIMGLYMGEKLISIIQFDPTAFMLFGTANPYGTLTSTYYLNVGFFLPIGGAVLVIYSLAAKVDPSKIVVTGSEFSEFNLKEVPVAPEGQEMESASSDGELASS